jgi:predicted transcriptional regulator YdeE
MQDYSHENFTVSGYKVSTNNIDNQSDKDIMAAWTKWKDENIADLIQGKTDKTIYCIYYNYQNPENVRERSYDLLIGFTTEKDAVQTSDLITTIEVPAQKYKYDSVKREDFPAFMAKWDEINSMNKEELNRTFGYDMDMYGEAETTIAVSVK